MTDFISQTTKQIKGRSKPCLYRRTGPQETKNYWLLRNLQWPKTGIYRTLYLIIQLFKHFFFYEKHWKKFVNINLSLYIRQLLQIITENRGIIIAFLCLKNPIIQHTTLRDITRNTCPKLLIANYVTEVCHFYLFFSEWKEQ